MKTRTFKYLLIISLIASFTSCKVNDGEDRNVSQPGYEMFCGWQTAFFDYFSNGVNLAYKFNYWLSAPDSLQTSIEDSYFSQYKIREAGDGTWQLLQATTVCVEINTHSQNLDDNGSSWNIRVYNTNSKLSYIETYTNYDVSTFTDDPYYDVVITASGNGTWSIQTNVAEVNGSKFPDTDTYVNFQLASDNPVDMFSTPFTISGEGLFRFTNHFYDDNESVTKYTFQKFQIEEAMVADGTYYSCNNNFNYTGDFNQFLWSSGSVTMNAYNTSNNNSTAKASFHKAGKDSYIIEIEFGGYHEEWDYEDIIYLK